VHTCSPTTGANVVLTHTMTLNAASQGGWVAAQQTVTGGGGAATSLPPPVRRPNYGSLIQL
jgi:hypothetical protein